MQFLEEKMKSVIWPKRAIKLAISLGSRFSSPKLPEITEGAGLVPGKASMESPVSSGH